MTVPTANDRISLIKDISLPFGLRWAASCGLDVMYFVTRAFKEQGGTALNYIDNLGGVTRDEQMAAQHFCILCSLLKHLGFERCFTKLRPQLKH